MRKEGGKRFTLADLDTRNRRKRTAPESPAAEAQPEITQEAPGFEGKEKIDAALGLRQVETISSLEGLLKEGVEESASPEYLQAVSEALANESDPRSRLFRLSANKTKRHYDHWSHAVCHLFEKYGTGTSVLDTEDPKIIQPLVDRSYQEALSRHDQGSLFRVVGGLEKHALHKMTVDSLDESVPYAPKDEDREGLAAVISDQFKFARDFLLAHTQRDLVSAMVKNEYFADKLKGLSPDKKEDVLAVLKEVQGSFDSPEAQETALKALTGEVVSSFEQLDGLPTAAELESAETLEGTYADVDGTLLIGRHGMNLNEKLLVELTRKHIETGEKIIIVTGGAPETAEKRLKAAGLSEDIFEFPVRSKSEIQGKNVRTLYDDTPPSLQGTGAHEYHAVGE